MHPDDLQAVWLCRECGHRFLFHSDVEDHNKQMNHSNIVMYRLKNEMKKLARFTRGKTSLGFRLDGKPFYLTIVYEYYPSSGEIHYIDVRYSHDRLKSLIEENQQFMKNIDNYLRKQLNSEQSENTAKF